MVETAVDGVAGGLHRHARRRRVRRRRGPPLGRAGRRGRRPVRDAPAAQQPTAPTRGPSSPTTARSPRPGCRSWPTTTRSTPRSTSSRSSSPSCTHEGLHRRGQGVQRRRPPAYQIDELAPGSTSCAARTTSLLELAIAGAPGWVAGYPNALPRACAELSGGATARGPRHRAAALPPAPPAPALGLARPSSSRRSSCRWTSSAGTAARAARRACRSRRSRRRGPARHGGRDRRRAAPERTAGRRRLTDAHASASSTPSTRTPRACRPG